MPSQFTIRAASDADEGPLGALDRRTWSPLHAVTPRPEPPYPSFFATTGPEDHLVADLTGRGLVGYVRLGRPTELECNAHVRQIHGLAVDERARGIGVARALLEGVCALARGRGARRLTLRVLGPNVPARALYESAGFRVEGVLPEEFWLDGAYVDDVLMGRSLAG
ncbi:GNAT family N-acetyltransferase [Streptomyces sp. DSM 42041]|uniref:GNAT family N-acetyltransferase n=1 Tax=Streptomyces hazeniae TaxID=3075538 RepID=A0ABU2NSQ0_9ACTN|nr:GNAT family N-acetyltransferase [Streptomyces sp. DSM 42041]MDT0379641.1 GNAT family N-acetyltransferase [Streptomyces sp. DSM 42041]